MHVETLFKPNSRISESNAHIKELHEQSVSTNEESKRRFLEEIVKLIQENLNSLKSGEPNPIILSYIALIIVLRPDFNYLKSLLNEKTPVSVAGMILNGLKQTQNSTDVKPIVIGYMNSLIKNPFPQTIKSYYSKTDFTSLNGVTKLIQSLISDNSVKEVVFKLFEAVKAINKNQITSSFVRFMSALYTITFEYLSSTKDNELQSAAVESFEKVISASSQTYNDLLLYFFEPFLSIYQNFFQSTDIKILSALVNIFTTSLEVMTNWKYVECKFNQSPHLFVKFFNLNNNITAQNLISTYCLHMIHNTTDKFLKIDDFSKIIINTNNPPLILTLFNYSQNFIGAIGGKFRRMVGSTVKESKKSDFVTQKFPFSADYWEEAPDSIDSDIFTKVTLKVFNNEEDAEKFYRKQLDNFIKLLGKFRNASFFVQSLLPLIIHYINSNNEYKTFSTTYISSFFASWISSILNVLHAKFVLTLWKKNDLFISATNTVFQSISDITRILNSASPQIIATITSNFGNIFFEHASENSLTKDALKMIKAMDVSEANQIRPLFTTLFSYSFKWLFDTACSKRNLIASRFEDEISKWGTYILFLVRSISYNKSNCSNLMLSAHKKFILTCLYINIKKAANHQCVTKCIKYIQNLINIIEDEQLQYGFKSSYLNDVLPDAQCELIFHAYNLISGEKSPAGISQLFPLIDTALRSEKPEHVEEAAKLIIKITSSDPELRSFGSRPQISYLFHQMIQKSHLLTEETRLNLTRAIPALASFIIQPEPLIEHPVWIVDGINFNIPLMLADIFINRPPNEETAYDIYSLIAILIEYSIQIIQREGKLDNKVIFSLILHLFFLTSFKKLYSFLSQEIQKFVDKFISIYYESKNSDFLFCLFQAGTASSSFVGKEIIKSARYFISEIKEHVEVSDITKIISDMLIYFKPPEMNAALLIGLSVIASIIPSAFTIPQAMIVIKVNEKASSLDAERSNIIEKTLENFSKEFPQKAKVRFVQDVFDYLGRNSCPSRFAIINGLKKICTPIQLNSYDEIETKGELIYALQQLSCAMICGITGKPQYTPTLQRTIQALFSYREDQSLALEYLAARGYLLYALLAQPDIHKNFVDDSPLSKLLCSFLLKSLTTRWKMVTLTAKQTLYLLATRDLSSSTFAKQVAEYSATRESVIQFYTTQPERMILYMRISRFMFHNVTSRVFLRFLQVYCKISRLPDSRVMTLLANLDGILKFLCIKKFSERNDLRAVLLDKDSGVENILSFIRATVTLLNHGEIPFKLLILDHVKKFLSLYADQAIQIFRDSYFSEDLSCIHLLSQLLTSDPSKKYIKYFCADIGGNVNFAAKYITVLHDLLKQPVSCYDDILIQTVRKIFEHVSMKKDDINAGDEEKATAIAAMHLKILANQDIDNEKNFNDVIDFVKIFGVTFIRNSFIFGKYVETFLINTPERISHKIGTHFCMDQGITDKNLFIFKNCLKYCHFSTEEVNNIFDSLMEKESVDNGIFLDSILYMIKHFEIDEDRRWMLSSVILANIKTPLTVILVLTLKLVKELVKSDTIEIDLLKSVSKVMFADQRLFSPPTGKYAFEILSYIETKISEFDDYLSPFVLNMVMEKLGNINDIRTMVYFFNQCPKMMNLLPFNFILLITEQLQKINDFDNDSIYLVVSFIDLLNVTYETNKEYYIYTSLTEIYRIMLNLFENLKDTEHFCYSLSQMIIKHKIRIPNQVLSSLLQRSFSRSIFYILISSLANPDLIFFETILEYYDNLLIYVFDVANYFNETELIDFMMSSLFGMDEYNQRFSYIFYPNLIEMMKSLNIAKIDRFIVLLNYFLKFCQNLDKAELLMQIMDKLYLLKENTDLKYPKLFNILVTSLSIVVPERQREYSNKLIEKAMINHDAFEAIIINLPHLMKSSEINIEIKKYLCMSLVKSKFEHFSDAERILDIIDYLIELNDKFGLFLTPLLLTILLMTIQNTTAHLRLKAISKFDKLLPSEIDEKVTYLIQNCPINIWGDQRISIIVTIIMSHESKIWWHLQMFPDSLKSILDETLQFIFTKTLEKGNVSLVVDFLVNAMRHGSMKIITKAIMYALSNCNMNLEQNILIHCLETTNSVEIYQQICGNEGFDIRTIHFDNLADYEFARNLYLMSPEQTAATAMSLLNQYKAASVLYQDFPEKLQDFNMRIVNDHFNSSFDQILPIKTVIKPMTSLKESPDKISEEIQNLFENFNPNTIKKQRKDIAIVQHSIANIFKQKKVISSPELERLICLESSTLILASVIDSYKSINLFDEGFVRAINPVMFSSLIRLERQTNETNLSQFPQIEENEEPILVVSSTMNSLFKSICGYTNRGLIAVSHSQITQHVNEITMRIEKRGLQMNELSRFAPLTFQIFCLQPNETVFKITSGAYLRILEMESTNFIRTESVARLITLLKIAVYDKKLNLDVSDLCSKISQLKNAENWLSFLQGLFCLAEFPWFIKAFQPMISKYPQISYIAAVSSENSEVAKIISNIYLRISETHLLNAIIKNINDLTENDIIMALRQHYLQKFLQFLMEKKFYRKVKSEMKKDDSELRKLYDEILVTDKETLDLDMICKEKLKNQKEIDEIIESVTGKPNSSETTNTNINEIVSNLNTIFPLPNNSPFQQTIFCLKLNDVTPLSDNLITIGCITESSEKGNLLVWSEPGIKFAVSSTVLTVIDSIFNHCYATHKRMIKLPVPQIISLGQAQVSLCAGDVNSLSSLLMASQKDILQNLTNKSDIDSTILQRYYQRKFNKHDYLLAKRDSAASFSGSCLVSTIFSLPYTDLQNLMIHENKIVLSPLSFYKNECGSPFRLSPNIMTFMGPNFEGVFMINFTAAAYSMMCQFELSRALFEHLVFDDENKWMENPSLTIYARRLTIEEKLIAISPPTGVAVTSEDCLDWINQLKDLIERAKDESLQPDTAIPWF
ncbi:hypothetical protein TVAG_120010 [Trichomonas vaginalis G3]|uniref:Uncharacterized protein n=1 Tax=Trichomonas vaginalis (strain ATCC PRA-98 / G3) TaxID=412133 RepID=A2D7E7_TRIV3|nr:protein kinase-like (PK-like) family [Trichomonas vaginalis G3]EAY23664.1 hypothetical protein TVAG_120010 [Trichomonas vaginalis G3]KAI5490156.1 protein kinase-like (PK-like) family [Trichomonas vaginalis G3]|eukprot:XP_001276912.1 hypothetical protein [Trichomonas vaginalis G3]